MSKPRPTRRIGRKRSALGWTLLTLGLLVAGVWVASGWWFETMSIPDGWLFIERGHLTVEVTAGGGLEKPRPFPGLNEYPPPRWQWRTGQWSPPKGVYLLDFAVLEYADWSVASRNPGKKEATVALWPIPLLLWTPAALLFRSGILARRRALTGQCKSCGYDLAGLAAGGQCPECGKASE